MSTKTALFGAVLLALSVSGAMAQDKTYKVGISLPEAQNPFYVLLGKSAVETFNKRGIETTLLSANADVNEQINNINDLVAKRVDAILMSPLDTDGPASAVKRAHDAGIPIFMVARTLDKRFGNIWKTFIGIHFDEIGKSKGEWTVKNTKSGKLAMLLGPAGALVMVEQEKAFRSVVEPAGYRVVFAQNSTQTRENGLKLSEDALIANPDLVAIYASNDDLALGAAQAVKAAGKLGQVAVIGLNGTPPALAAVHKGEMAATVLLDPIGWGRTAATTVADYLQNKKEPEPFVTFQYKLVGKDDAFDLIPVPLRERLGVKK
ncbi:ABC transporter substrate-binding protein [Microbacteriaceae bacterium K1510]|nr:ABC transporter substrate-binding protein [Microbacteriaceae bacterium K1510]